MSFRYGAHGRTMRIYRCVYCKRRVGDRTNLPSHEMMCEFRAVVRMQWAMAIEKAKRKEQREKKLAI